MLACQTLAKLLTFLTAEGRAIHRLAHHPQDKLDRVLDLDIVLVLLFQQALRCPVVRADACRFPAGVVTRGIRVV